jgi:zinc protease
VTSVSFARAVLPLVLSSCAALAGGCRTLGGPAPAGAEAPVAIGGPSTRAEHRLANGVRVVIEENHAAPAVAVQVWVAGGAAADPPALAGSAHFFEHLLYRGTKRRAPAVAAREIEALGGTLGAWTGLEETVYHAAVAAPFLETALDVLGDALANPSFEPAEVERARRVILDEIAAARADGARRASEALLAAAFAGQPAARPLLGTEAGVAARTRAELLARFADSYVGEAMTVVVVGDVDASRARTAVAAAFAAVPRGSRPREAAPAAGPAPAPPRLTFTSGSRTLEGPELVLGFRSPAEGPEEAAALDLAAAVLARGDTARLGRELVRNRQLAIGVRGTTFCSRAGGLVALAVTPAGRRLDELAERAVELGLGLPREELGADELARARAAVEGDLARGEAGIEGRARRLGFAAAIAGDLGWESRYRARLRTIDGPELRAAAAKVFRADALTMAVVLPQGMAGAAAGATSGEAEAALRPRLEAALAGAEARAARAERSTGASDAIRVAAGDVVRFAVPSGPRLIVVRDASAPLVTVEAAWAAGGATAAGAGAEDRGDRGPAGAGPLIAALLGRGSRTRSAAEIAAEMRGIGGAIEGFSEGGTLGLRADFLSSSSGLERGVALVADGLLHPSFTEAALDGERRALLEHRAAAGRGTDAGARAALQLFQDTLVPGRRPPDPEALSGLTRVRLLDAYRRRYPLSELVVAVVGDVDPQRVTAAFLASFAEAPPAPPPSVTTPPAPSRLEPATVFRPAGGADADVVVGYPTFAPGDPDRLPLELLAEILAGDGGRLAGLLRGDKTLAYRVSGHAAGATEPGYLAVALTCAPARLDDVVAAVRAAFAAVVAGGVNADEVNRAARRLVGARAAALRSRAAIAHALVLDEARGLPLLAYRGEAARIVRLGPEDVARAARRALDPNREVIAVISGPGTSTAAGRGK